VSDIQPAGDLVHELARRLQDDQIMRSSLASYRATSRFAATVGWTPAGWGFGEAGLAMLCAEVHRANGGDSWARAAHEHLLRGAATLAAESGPGLFDGSAGFGFITATLASGGNYTRLAAQVADRLVPAIAASAGTGSFDLLSGLAGQGIYLLSLTGDDHQQARLAVRVACDRLLRLSDITGAPGIAVAVPADAGFPPRVTRSVSCGMAHGVAGLISTRARLAMVAGETGATLDNLRAATSWVMAQRIGIGPLWPRAVLFDRHDRVCGQAPASSPSWWCTGGAGIARALWLSGTATGAAEPGEMAIDVMARLAADQSSWPATSGLCHGVAGLLVIAQEFARDTGRPEMTDLASALTEILVSRFDAATLLGYQNVETSGRTVDDPGVMLGTTGIALGVAAAISPSRSGWTRAMGL
jgi:lantibiotic modifying enzyme